MWVRPHAASIQGCPESAVRRDESVVHWQWGKAPGMGPAEGAAQPPLLPTLQQLWRKIVVSSAQRCP